MMRCISNPHHLALEKLYRSHSRNLSNNDWVRRYLGTTKPYLGLPTKEKQNLTKDYLKSQNLDNITLDKLLISLSRGQSFEEVSAVGYILTFSHDFRRSIEMATLDQLLDHVEGWAETDTICQMSFTADELLSRWSDWENLLKKFRTDPNIHKRRASLVLLTKPLRQSADPRLASLALENTAQLMAEKHILITKAISWILRSMIKHHPALVENYLEKNQELLPKIALRETHRKLLTGRK